MEMYRDHGAETAAVTELSDGSFPAGLPEYD